MLYDNKTWTVKEAELLRLGRSDMRMIRWMSNVTLKNRKSSSELRERLGLDSRRLKRQIEMVWPCREMQ